MKLVASLIVHNEADRYLRPCLDHLLEFCDEIRIVDDASTDDFKEIGWYDDPRVQIQRNSHRVFFDHEGQARQALLEWTLLAEPTYVLAIDADEFVDDGSLLRRVIQREHAPVWSLCMREIWKADKRALQIRQDGGWCEHPVSICWQVPNNRAGLSIPARQLACGRVPDVVNQLARRRAQYSDVGILHFGWANQAERAARHHRYVVADGGKFHAGSHLDSIMWGDSRVKLERTTWPEGLDSARILEGVNRLGRK